MKNRMDQLKKRLSRPINIKTTYLVLLVVISLGLVAIYFSYALFTISVEKKGVLNVVTANLYASIVSEDLDSNHQVAIQSGETKILNITLSNINSVDVKTNLYYEVISGSMDNVILGYVDFSQDAAPPVGGYIISKYGTNNEKIITIAIINHGDAEVTLKFGTDVGLSTAALAFPTNGTTIALLEPTPESCFDFDESTGSITLYKCGAKIWNGSSRVDATSELLPEGIDSPIIDVVIPKTIRGVPVTQIETTTLNKTKGNFPFNGMGITSVVIPDGVTSLGSWAFGQNELTSVVIPNSVASLTDSVFAYNQLINVVISNSVTSIGSGAFKSNQLTNVTIPDSVISIGDGVFASNQLTSVTIPSSVKNIGQNAFSPNKLTSVIIKGKSSSANFTSYPSSSPFGWADGYSDDTIKWEP